MKVKELKALLETLDDEYRVVLSKDSEGNSFSPLCDHTIAVYVPETTWYGDIYLSELTPELRKQGYTEEDTYQGDDGEKAVVFWPY